MLLLALASSALAIPMQLNHSGRLLDGGGVPLAGSQPVTFSLYNASSSGSLLWEETLTVDFDDGYFNVVLGTDTLNNAIDAGDLDHPTVWIELAVSGSVLPQRQQVVSVPYAYHAMQAETAVDATNVTGGVVDASEIRINGSVVIDDQGALQGPGDGDTLAALSCNPNELPLWDGTAWGCAAAASATVTWDDVTAKPSGFADGNDDDTLGALTCLADQVPMFSGASWGCSPLPTLPAILDDGDIDWTEVQNTPAVLSDGDISWAELVGIPATLSDGDVDWGELTGIPLDLADGTIAWTELTGIPTDLADGTIAWSELAGIPAALADGDVGWSELVGIPGALADGSIAWGEVTGVPGDLLDGDDVLSSTDVLGIVEGGDLNLNGSIQVADNTASCDSSAHGMIRFDGVSFQACSTAGWVTFAGGFDGGSPLQASENCRTLHDDFASLPDGTYWIDPDGIGSGAAAVQVYCDMTTDGGGWTLAGYSHNSSASTSGGNHNMRSLKCGGGSYDPESRGTSSAGIAAVSLAQGSTEVAFSMSTGGQVVNTGNMSAYSESYKFTIPVPSALHFDTHSTLGPSFGNVGPCTPVTVTGIAGTSFSGTRYTRQNVLGASWGDSYPTGYGAVTNSACTSSFDGGPFVTSIQTSQGHGTQHGTAITECDVVNGSYTYVYRGNYTPGSVNRTGSHAVWFR